MKPLLKWAGGKSRLGPIIESAFSGPCDGVYVEPFLGSGASLLYRRSIGALRGRIIAADINANLINFHQSIKADPESVITCLEEMPSDATWGNYYAEIRQRYNASAPWGPEQAARFLWLNRACFNGLYRENAKGEFNTPKGSYTTLSFPSRTEILHVSALYADVEFRNETSSDLFRSLVADESLRGQIYCDPPYLPLSTSASFSSYHAEGFGGIDHVILAGWVHQLADRFESVISNHEVPVIPKLYPADRGFSIQKRIRVRRSISANSDARTSPWEIMVRIGGPAVSAAPVEQIPRDLKPDQAIPAAEDTHGTETDR